MDITRLIVALLIGLAILMLMIMKTKIHAALALILCAALVGIIGGVPIETIPGLITGGFGGTLGSIGIVIGFGVMMGQIMEESNAATVMARTFVRALRGRHENVAIALTGFMVSIPIFADSGYVILLPLIKAISKNTKRSLTALGITLGMSLAITHATIPPTPGPLGVVGIFGVNLGSFILFSLVMGLPIMGLAIILGNYFGNKKHYKYVNDAGEVVDASKEDILRFRQEERVKTFLDSKDDANFPKPLISFTPILLPVVLILLNTVLSAFYAKAEQVPFVIRVFQLIGNPIIAVAFGLLAAIYGLTRNKDRQSVIKTMEKGLESAGLIILITGAGGAFGNIIRSSGVGDAIAQGIIDLNFPALLIPFLIAGILKFSLGSGTVAMITAASICAPIFANLPNVNLMFAAYAACIGSQMFSLYNDSFFWVVTRPIGLKTVKEQVIAWNGTEFLCTWFGFLLLVIVDLIF